MSQTPTDNHHLFRHRQDVGQPSNQPASWLTAPRVGWTAQQNAKRDVLSNSPEGRQVNGVFILGGSARIQGRL